MRPNMSPYKRRVSAKPRPRFVPNTRAGIEGTLAQTIRRSGLRQARYIGLQKIHAQQVFTAAARNVVRVTNWLAHTPKRKARRSAFASLVAPS
jgi:transposase